MQFLIIYDWQTNIKKMYKYKFYMNLFLKENI